MFYDHELLLGSVGLSRRVFYTSKLVNNFGEKEDIPAGYHYELLFGKEWNDDFERDYFGAIYRNGGFNKLGYLSGSVQAGGFIRNGDWDQVLLSMELKGFGRGKNYSTFQMRSFYGIFFMRGFHRHEYEYVRLGGYYGINGLNSTLLTGVNRFVVKYENVIYPRWRVADFNFAFMLFAQSGVVGSGADFMIKENYYSGLGIGLRINNENLFFKTLQFRLAYYPTIPINEQNHWYFNLEGTPRFGFDRYILDKPEIIDYQ